MPVSFFRTWADTTCSRVMSPTVPQKMHLPLLIALTPRDFTLFVTGPPDIGTVPPWVYNLCPPMALGDRRINNPILNSPFDRPTRYFRFDDKGITPDIAEGRRPSSYFVPIPAAKKRGGMTHLYGKAVNDFPAMAEEARQQRRTQLSLPLGTADIEYIHEPPLPPLGSPERPTQP